MDDVQNHQIEVTYAAATGRWIGANWTHEAHSGRGPCATCAAAAKAAHATEAAAAIALEAARADDWTMAVTLAQCMVRLEDECPMTPVDVLRQLATNAASDVRQGAARNPLADRDEVDEVEVEVDDNEHEHLAGDSGLSD